GGGLYLCLRLRRDGLDRRLQDPGAVGEVVGEVRGALAGVDLLDDRVPPAKVRVAERLDGEGPAAHRVRLDRPIPRVGAVVDARHPGERPLPAVRTPKHDVAPERGIALAIGPGRPRHQLADHRLGRVTPTCHRWRDIFDGEPSDHAAYVSHPTILVRGFEAAGSWV